MKRINETLNKPSQSHVLSTVSSIYDFYEPIEDYFKSLSTQTGEDFEKVLIMDFTSSNAISDMDKYINNIKPSVNNLFSSLNAKTNGNINSIVVNSVEQFGLTASNNMNFDQLFSVNNKDVNTEVFSNALKLSDNMNFDQVLDGIKNAENNFYKNVVTKLDDINSKYGDVNNSDFVKKMDANAYEIDTYA